MKRSKSILQILKVLFNLVMVVIFIVPFLIIVAMSIAFGGLDYGNGVFRNRKKW